MSTAWKIVIVMVVVLFLAVVGGGLVAAYGTTSVETSTGADNLPVTTTP